MNRLAISLTTALLATSLQSAVAKDINTGGDTGAYHRHFCPAVEKQLKDAKFDYTCRTSAGTAENLKRVAADPTAIGYAQFDIFALLAPGMSGTQTFTTIRSDDVRECLFAVTRNPQIQNFGEIAVHAAKVKFILPPKDSGSAHTFNYLQKIDPDGLGKATNVTNVGTTKDAISAALADEEGVTLFVQFPDPANERFKLIDKLKGRVIPVIDRSILRQEIDGKKVYFAQETQVSTGSWLKTKKTVVTACTPLILFTGNPDRITGDTARQDHRDLVKTLQALRPEQVMLENNMFTRIWKRTRELSATSASKLIELSDQARENAKPYVEQAREAAKPYIEKAKEGVKDLIEKAKPH
ncbi:MAG: hypothetical protein RLZ98_1392 [Pseudomonadota bacterium]